MRPKGFLRYRKRMVVSKDEMLKTDILEETHRSKYMVHLDSSKMYQNLKGLYWWDNMKKKIAQYIQTYFICQQVKGECQKPLELLQSLEIPE